MTDAEGERLGVRLEEKDTEGDVLGVTVCVAVCVTKTITKDTLGVWLGVGVGEPELESDGEPVPLDVRVPDLLAVPVPLCVRLGLGLSVIDGVEERVTVIVTVRVCVIVITGREADGVSL